MTTCTRKHPNINVTNTGKGNNRRWQATGGQRGQRANSAGRFRHDCTRKYTSRVNPSAPFQGKLITADLQTPYKIKLPACTRKHLNITLPIPARATIGVGKPQADSECNKRIPPDGFDMAALENHCPQASPRGDVGDSPTYFKGGSSVLTIAPKNEQTASRNQG